MSAFISAEGSLKYHSASSLEYKGACLPESYATRITHFSKRETFVEKLTRLLWKMESIIPCINFYREYVVYISKGAVHGPVAIPVTGRPGIVLKCGPKSGN